MRKKSVIRYLITVNTLLFTCSEPVIKPFRTQYLITDIGLIDCLKVMSGRKITMLRFLVVSYNSLCVCTKIKKRLNKIAVIVGMIVK